MFLFSLYLEIIFFFISILKITLDVFSLDFVYLVIENVLS